MPGQESIFFCRLNFAITGLGVFAEQRTCPPYAESITGCRGGYCLSDRAENLQNTKRNGLRPHSSFRGKEEPPRRVKKKRHFCAASCISFAGFRRTSTARGCQYTNDFPQPVIVDDAAGVLRMECRTPQGTLSAVFHTTNTKITPKKEDFNIWKKRKPY